MGKQYQNRLLYYFNILQKDLASKKISEEQFKFLVGFLLQHETSRLIDKEINELLPHDDNDQMMTVMSYERNRKFDYAR